MEIKGYKIIDIEISNYSHNGNTAITLICEDEGIACPFAVITVNLGITLEKDYAFIDTNNCNWVEKWLQDNKFGEPTGQQMASGFCVYPLYKLNLNNIKNFFLTNKVS